MLFLRCPLCLVPADHAAGVGETAVVHAAAAVGLIVRGDDALEVVDADEAAPPDLIPAAFELRDQEAEHPFIRDHDRILPCREDPVNDASGSFSALRPGFLLPFVSEKPLKICHPAPEREGKLPRGIGERREGRGA